MSTTWMVFFGLWLGLTIGSYALFHRKTGVAFKRRWWPRYTALSHTVIAAFLWWAGLPLWYWVPLMALLIALTILTVRSTYFCERCERATRHPFFMRAPTQCSHCHKA